MDFCLRVIDVKRFENLCSIWLEMKGLSENKFISLQVKNHKGLSIGTDSQVSHRDLNQSISNDTQP